MTTSPVRAVAYQILLCTHGSLQGVLQCPHVKTGNNPVLIERMDNTVRW